MPKTAASAISTGSATNALIGLTLAFAPDHIAGGPELKAKAFLAIGGGSGMAKKDQIDLETMEKVLQEYEEGMPAAQLCRKYGIARSTFYYWLSKTTATGSAQKDRLVALKAENARLKIILAERVLEMILEQANLSDDQQWRKTLTTLLTVDDTDQ